MNGEQAKKISRINKQTDIDLATLIDTYTRKTIQKHYRKTGDYNIPTHMQNNYGEEVINTMERYASMKHDYKSELQEAKNYGLSIAKKFVDIFGSVAYNIIEEDFVDRFRGSELSKVETFGRYLTLHFPEVRK